MIRKKIHLHLQAQSIIVTIILLFLYFSAKILIPIQADLSEEKFYTLSDGFIRYLEEYKEPVELKVFLDKSPASERFRHFIEEINTLNRQYISVEFLNKDNIQEKLLDYTGTFSINSVLIKKNGSYRLVTGRDKNYFLKQFYLVCQNANLRIGYLTGHRELPIINPNHPERALDQFRNTFINSGFDFQEVTLNTEFLNSGCFLLILMAPVTELSEEELITLNRYLVLGGNVMAFYEPSLTIPRGTRIHRLFKECCGIEFEQGIILHEEKANPFDKPNPTQPKVEKIIDPFFQKHFPAQGTIKLNISAAFQNKGKNITPIMALEKKAWLEKDVQRLIQKKEAGYHEETDLSVPLYPAIAVNGLFGENTPGKGLFFGDSDWVQNQNLYEEDHLALLQTSIKYFAPQITFIDELPGEIPINPVTWNSNNRFRLFAMSFGVPFACMLLLLVNIWKRRSK